MKNLVKRFNLIDALLAVIITLVFLVITALASLI